MKILLLRPDSQIPSIAPPLGLLYLASYLREYSSHQVSLCDARFTEYDGDALEQAIRDESPDLVGISALSVEAKETHKAAQRSKEACPRAIVVLGGPYPTSAYEQAMEDPNVDITVIGEGEKSFSQLVNALDNGQNWREIRELAYRENGAVKKSDAREFIENLDELPYPAWDMLPLDDYFNRRGTRKRASSNQHQMKKRVLPIQTTRGCPYHCNYCHNLFGKKLRKRSVENVIGELRLMQEQFRIEEIEIMDDTFNVDLERGKQIFRRIIEEKLDFKYSFTNGLRADRMDEELLDLFKEAGVYRMVYAIESGSPRIQKMIRKNVDLDRARQVIDMSVRRGFSVGGFFMMGFLDETEEEVWNTINFALESPLHTATFSIMTPFPHTEVWHQLREMGYDLSADYKHFQRVTLNPSKVPSERLAELRKIAFRRFYLNPKRILSILRTTPWQNRALEKILIVIGVAFFKYDK